MFTLWSSMIVALVAIVAKHAKWWISCVFREFLVGYLSYVKCQVPINVGVIKTIGNYPFLILKIVMCESQWCALAEINLRSSISVGVPTADLYCLCSRVFLRDNNKDENELPTPSHKPSTTLCNNLSPSSEDVSEEDVSIDNLKLTVNTATEGTESVSCYCSASHTDNLSTDEHDSVHDLGGVVAVRSSVHATKTIGYGGGNTVSGLHASDSGADLSEHLRYDMDIEWQRFWSHNGEKLIWQSWISRYSAYIDPEYWSSNNNNNGNAPSQEQSQNGNFTQFLNVQTIAEEDGHEILIDNKNGIGVLQSNRNGSKCSSLRTVDSMTNVTRITASSIDCGLSPKDEGTADDGSGEQQLSDDEGGVGMTNEPKLSLQSSTTSSSVDSTDNDEADEDYQHQWNVLWKSHYYKEYEHQYKTFIEQWKDHNQIDAAMCEHMDKHNIVPIGHSNHLHSKNIQGVFCGRIQHNGSRSINANQKAKVTLNASLVTSLGNLLKSRSAHAATNNCQIVNETEPKQEAISEQIDNQECYDGDSIKQEQEDMVKMGLPIAFGKSCNRRQQFTNSVMTRSAPLELTENADRIKAAFLLMGLEYEMPKNADPLIGTVHYRMRHIRLQNRSLRLRSHNKHIRFDEDGNVINTHIQPQVPSDNYTSDEECVATISIPSVHISSTSIEADVPQTETIGESILCNKPTKKTIGAGVSVTAEEEDGGEEEDESNAATSNCITTVGCNLKQRRKRKKKSISTTAAALPAEIRDNMQLRKFWHRRFLLFSRFDEGIRLDEESWYSVTPERIARHIAQRCSCGLVVDGFCGAGGNSIQLAFYCDRVLAIDIDPEKIALAQHNARVYGVSHKIDFVVADFFKLIPILKNTAVVDVIFISPPWGGLDYNRHVVYDLETMLMPPFGIKELLRVARIITHNVAIFLPKNSNAFVLIDHTKCSGGVEIEQNFMQNNLVAITAYYNDLIKKKL